MQIRPKVAYTPLVPLLLFAFLVQLPILGAETSSFPASLPPGVQAVWDVASAFHETTPLRERICLNGLWLWQPADPKSITVPDRDWGYFKVPGSWPGITDYMQKDCQTLYP